MYSHTAVGVAKVVAVLVVVALFGPHLMGLHGKFC